MSFQSRYKSKYFPRVHLGRGDASRSFMDLIEREFNPISSAPEKILEQGLELPRVKRERPELSSLLTFEEDELPVDDGGGSIASMLPMMTPSPRPRPGGAQQPPSGGGGGDILYIGDSLTEGMKPLLGPRFHVNSRGGRPSPEGVPIVKKNKGRFDTIVFDLGTNDGSLENLRRSVNQVLRNAGGARIVMATVNSPTDQKRKNAFLQALARKGRIELVNTMNVQLSGDGIHPTAQGYKQRARLMRRALG
jgi:hypothetical protein